MVHAIIIHVMRDEYEQRRGGTKGVEKEEIESHHFRESSLPKEKKRRGEGKKFIGSVIKTKSRISKLLK